MANVETVSRFNRDQILQETGYLKADGIELSDSPNGRCSALSRSSIELMTSSGKECRRSTWTWYLRCAA
jgi:hypothetical protein